jgi:hypothetical protein
MPFFSQVVLAAFAVIAFGCQHSEPQAVEIPPASPKVEVTVQEPPAPAPEIREVSHSSQTNSALMINDARLHLEMGRFYEAVSKLKEVLRNDPEARAAHYYLSL